MVILFYLSVIALGMVMDTIPPNEKWGEISLEDFSLQEEYEERVYLLAPSRNCAKM